MSTRRTHSIITIVPQTADFVYDLTTPEAVNAEFSTGLSTTALEEKITSTSLIIAGMCDRVFALQNVTEAFNISWQDDKDALNLSRYPVIEINSVTVNGSEISAADYEIDKDAGLLYRAWGCWGGTIVVEYSGGYDLPDQAPPALSRATIELIKEQQFATSRNPSVRSLSNSIGDSVTYFDPRSGIGAALPTAVVDLITPFKRYAV